MERTYRLYGFVPYNLSPIQQGIQFGHGVVEYAQKYFKDKTYQQWAKDDKTFIILNLFNDFPIFKSVILLFFSSIKKKFMR